MGQNTPNNGVPPSNSQQHHLDQNTPDRVPPIVRNDDEQGQQTNQMSHNTPFRVLPYTTQKPIVSGQTTQTRVPLTLTTDTGEKGDETFSLAASNLFFQGNENEIQKVAYSCSAKGNDNHSSALGSTHDEEQKYCLQSKEEYDDIVEVGPEVLSSMASAKKSFGRSH